MLGVQEICMSSKSTAKFLEEEESLPRVKHKDSLTQPALDQQIAGSWQSIWEGRSNPACLLCSYMLPQAIIIGRCQAAHQARYAFDLQDWRKDGKVVYQGSVVNRI